MVYVDRNSLTSLSGSSIGIFSIDNWILSQLSGSRVIGISASRWSVPTNFNSVSLVSKHIDRNLLQVDISVVCMLCK